jgi:hypothetical protein
MRHPEGEIGVVALIRRKALRAERGLAIQSVRIDLILSLKRGAAPARFAGILKVAIVKFQKAVGSVILLAALATGAHAEQSRDLRVENVQAIPGPVPGVSYIAGSATNVGSKLIGDAFVKFNLYDKDNAVVGQSMDKVSNLQPGETWRFRLASLFPTTISN